MGRRMEPVDQRSLQLFKFLGRHISHRNNPIRLAVEGMNVRDGVGVSPAEHADVPRSQWHPVPSVKPRAVQVI